MGRPLETEEVSGQQNPGRGEKAGNARSWAKSLPGRGTGRNCGLGEERGPLDTPVCCFHPSFFSLTVFFLSLSPSPMDHLVSVNIWRPDLLSLSLALFSVSVYSNPPMLSVFLTLNHLLSAFSRAPSHFLRVFAPPLLYRSGSI